MKVNLSNLPTTCSSNLKNTERDDWEMIPAEEKYLESIVQKEIKSGDYRNIWVLIEQERGTFSKKSIKVLGKARELANMLGTKVEAICFSQETQGSKELISYGADTVYLIKLKGGINETLEVYKKALEKIVKEKKPEVLLFAHTDLGVSLAGQLSAALKTGAVTEVEDLSLDTVNRLLIQTKSIFNSKQKIEAITPKTKPQIATVKVENLPEPFKDEFRYGSSSMIEIKDLGVLKTEIVGKECIEERKFAEQEVIVCGGLELGEKENFLLLKEFGELIGASVIPSFAALSMFASEEKAFNYVDKKLKPKLLILWGVMGTFENLYWFEPEHVLAVTGKRDNPALKIAELSLVGQVTKILKEIVKLLKTKQFFKKE